MNPNASQSSSPRPGSLSSNPLNDLITGNDSQAAFPKRSDTNPNASQSSSPRPGASSKSPLTDILMAKDSEPKASFPERSNVTAPPSSQSSSPRQGSPSTPKRKVAPPSSQTTSPRQGAPALQEDSPANTTRGPSDSKNPLTNLLREKDASTQGASFPTRQDAPVKTLSQAVPDPAVGAKKLSLTDLLPSRAKPFRATQPRPSSPSLQALPKLQERAGIVSKPEVAVKKRSLKDFIPGGKPIGSNRKTGTKLGGMASPEQAESSLKTDRQNAMKEEVVASATMDSNTPKKEAPELAPAAQPSVSSLSEIIRNHKPRERTSSKRITKTKLGEMANPAFNAGTPPEVQSIAATKSGDTAEDNSVSAANAVESSMKKQEASQRALLSANIANTAKAKISASAAQSASTTVASSQAQSLSQIVRGQNKPTFSQQKKAYANSNHRSTLFAGSANTKLGEMANPSAKVKVEPPPEPVAIVANDDTIEQDNAMSVAKAAEASTKTQEAFQRALLSARVANDAKAKIFGAVVQQDSADEADSKSASLSTIIQSQDKPTLSQQKAYANSNRRTSLFPEKTESHLSRLLKK